MNLQKLLFFIFGLLFFTSSNAQLNTQKKYGCGTAFTSYLITLDLKANGILISSASGKLIRLNNAYDTVWVKTMPDFSITDAIQNADNDIVLIGQKNYITTPGYINYGIQILKIDVNGNLITSRFKYIGTSAVGSFIQTLRPSLVEYKANNYIVSVYDNQNLNQRTSYLLKLDNSLTVIENKKFDLPSGDPLLSVLPLNRLLKKSDSEIIIYPKVDYSFYALYSNFQASFLVIDTGLNNTYHKQLNESYVKINSMAVSGDDIFIGGNFYSNKLIHNQFDNGLYITSYFTKINISNSSSYENRRLLFSPGYIAKSSIYQSAFYFFNNSLYNTAFGSGTLNIYNNIINDSVSKNFRTRITKLDTSLQIQWNKRIHISGTKDVSDFQNTTSSNDFFESENILINKNNQLLDFSYHGSGSFPYNNVSAEELGVSLTAIDTSGNSATCNITDENFLYKYDSVTVLDNPVINYIPDTITFINNIQTIVNSPLIKISDVCLPLIKPTSKFFWQADYYSYGFNDVICKDSKIRLIDKSYNEPKTWHWIFPPEADLTALDSLYLPDGKSISFNQSGVFPVSLVTTNVAGSDTSTQYITVVNFIPQPQLGNDTAICNGDSIMIIYNDPANSGHYFTGPYIYNTTDTLIIKDSGQYILAAYTACGALYDTINVKVAFTPTAKFGFAAACDDLTVAFTDSSKLNGNTVITYQYAWKPALAPATAYTNFSTLPNNNFSFPSYDSFDVRLIVTSPLNCVQPDTIIKRILLKAKPVAACTAISNCGNLNATFTSTATIAAGAIAQQEYYVNNTLIGTGTSFNYLFAGYGSYLVKQVVKSTFNCISDTFLLPLIIKDKPQVNLITARDSVCNSSTYTITASATVSGSTVNSFVWLKDNVLLPNNTNTITASDPTGIYTYKLAVTSALGCQSDTAVKTITVVSKPTATINAVNNCGSKQISITSAAAVINDAISNYYINYGDGNTALTNPNNTIYTYALYGTYNLKYAVQSSIGCASDTAYQTIAVKDKPQVNSITARDSVCNSNSYTITATATVNASTIISYVWLKNNVQLPNNTASITEINPTGIYTYKLVVTSAQGCQSDTVVKTITVVSKPVAAINAINNCGSRQISITGAASVINDNIIGNYISYGDGNNSTVNPNNTTYTYAAFGTYILKYVAKSSVGCASDTIYQTIQVKDKPVAAISYGNNACENTNYFVTATASVSASTIINYTWLRNGTVLPNNTSTLIENNLSGSYTYKLVATSAQGCISDTVTQIVLVEKYPTTIFTASGGCVGKSITITNNSVNNNPSGTLQYLWNTSDGQTSTVAVPVFTFAASGTKNIQLTTSTQNGCANSITKTITIDDYPVAAFDITQACLGKYITINNNSTGVISNYAWQTSDAQQSNAALPQFIFNTPGNYNITLQVATANNCSAEITKSTSIIPVQLFTSPVKDTNAVTGQPVQITVSGADTYIWQPFTNLSNAGISNPVFTPTATGIYPLSVEGTTAQGCKGNASISIKVFPANNLILIPNAFSPNADGLNDKFHITCSGLQSLTGFTIFNRYGQIVYQQNTCFAAGWDGNFKGSAQPLGTYVYHCQGIDFNGKKVSGKGAIILVR